MQDIYIINNLSFDFTVTAGRFLFIKYQSNLKIIITLLMFSSHDERFALFFFNNNTVHKLSSTNIGNFYLFLA